MEKNNYRDKLESLLIQAFISTGYKITKDVELCSIPESSKYEALNFSINNQNIVYRKGKITEDRPGAFLAVWKRPSVSNTNKPIPLQSNELDYLFVEVEEHSNITSNETLISNPKKGIFVFPVSILLKKGIISSETKKGKTGFRVFPPWSEDRGLVGMKIFSESGKKTQRWQLPYYIEIDKNGLLDFIKLKEIFENSQ
ncbi:hypothetical protein MNB_SM-4-1750 [hydrothermal vent metagenome]|uniref:MepB protein n=1 Tax=hydrothermal vent metagenome TaxID=652676 RepID=A0A1W1C8S4_9ZZZZ